MMLIRIKIQITEILGKKHKKPEHNPYERAS